MNVKEGLGVSIACVALMGTGYAAALKGGWVVDTARAQTIAQQAVTPEELARLEFALEYKQQKLRQLRRVESLSPDEEQDIADLEDDCELIKARIAELKSQMKGAG